MQNQKELTDLKLKNNLRILVVDAETNFAFSSSLRELGYAVTHFRASEAVVPDFDIAFVGARSRWSKPFVTRLKTANARSPLVAIIDTLNEREIVSARETGFDDVITASPISSQLGVKIATWCATAASPLVLDPTPILELQKLQLEDGSGLVPALVKLFFASQTEIDRLHEAFTAGDFDGVRTIAHDLKSTCANLGVIRMKCVCHKIELSEEADDMRVAIALLESEFELAKRHFERATAA